MAVNKGYKQSEIGLIPEDWDIHYLGDLAEICMCRRILAEQTHESGDVPFFKIGTFGGTPDAFIPYRLYEEYRKNYSFPHKGDVLISAAGTLGRAIVYDGQDAYFQDSNIVWLDVNKRLICNEFLYYCYQRIQWAPSEGSTISRLYNGIIRATRILLPSTIAEQEAIAGVLSDADAWIESLEQLIAKKRQIKQGAMQELLTGKRRLPGFSGKWETKRLGDLGSTYGGLTGKTKTDFGAGGAMYVTFMNVMSNVVIDCTTFERVNVVASESQNRVVKNDILFNGSSETPEEVAMCALVDTDVTDVYLNSFCFGFRFREDVTVDGRFLAYYLRSNVGREIMKSLAQGSTRYNLSKTALLRAVLQLPSPNEQTAIATVLSDMDSEIESLESKLAKACEVKQGMMQELLTGRIRLV